MQDHFLLRPKMLFMLLAVFLGLSSGVKAQSKTEGELVQKIVASLQQMDSFAYSNVFPSADTLARITIRKAPHTSEAYQRAIYMVASPEMLLYQDTASMNQSHEWFRKVLMKGEQQGIHWNDILLSRFELEQLAKTRDEALEAIAPERFVGYVFVQDMQTRKTFTFTVSDMKKMDGKWYGGELGYIFEAETKDIFNGKVKADKIRILKGIPDSTELAAATDTTKNQGDDEPITQRKQIADRKLYTGMLDNEIPVSLYIRYIKGDCSGGICSWEAIFKFGDNDYVKQEVSKNEDGKWVFLEEESKSSLELELKGTTFTGILSATIDKVDYDAELVEKTMSKKKLESLDAIIEKDLTR